MAGSILPLVLEDVAYAPRGQPLIGGISLTIDAGNVPSIERNSSRTAFRWVASSPTNVARLG